MKATKGKLVVLDEKKKTNAEKPKPKRKSAVANPRGITDGVAAGDRKPVVDALMTRGNGKTLRARFLYELAQTAEGTGEGQNARQFRSMASEWANSPKWKGGPPQAATDENEERMDD